MAEQEYQWRELSGPKPAVEAQIFGDLLEQLANGDDPRAVKPQQIVDAARKRGSPIRELFLWNDDEAAENYRCWQARRYLSLLQVVLVEVRQSRAISSRAFFSVTDRGERGYVPRGRVLSDRDLKRQVIASAKRELEVYVAKFAGVMALSGHIPKLEDVIADMQREIDALAELASNPPPPRGRPRGKRSTAHATV
jgi:hypothetical protein